MLATDFWLNPVLEQSKLFSEAAKALMDYANALGSREINDRSNEAQRVLRDLSCKRLMDKVMKYFFTKF